MTIEETRAIIESELGGALEEFFPQFNWEPIGAASVAQVHEARTRTNARVAVKIQRQGIRRIFLADWRNLRRLAVLADALGLLGKLSITEMVEEFGTWTLQELDFTVEGRTADRVRANAMPYEIIPMVYWELTTPKLLTMEFIDAFSLSQLTNLLDAGEVERIRARLPQLDFNQALHHLVFASLHQLFITGFYHGDPHPGNVLIRDDNTVAFVDFGIFGELTTYERETLAGQIENIALGNVYESFRYYSRQLTPTDETDLKVFQQEGLSVLRQWYEASIKSDAMPKELHLSKYTGDMIDVSRRNQLRFGVNYLLFWRALNALNASVIRVPHFNLMEELRAFFEHIRPNLAQRVKELLTDESQAVVLAALLPRLPDHFARTLGRVTQGQEWPLYVQESPAMQRARDRHTRLLQVGVFGISLAVLCVVTKHLDRLVRMPILGLAILLLIVPIVALVKGKRG